ncbi:hypothetical protein DPMN_187872 [Dreissena polymorpha]|uniref:NACHT domain-containing protein n=1 Tax=Dreissena polymorpha TaxID=45954 RepID=A0A9D4DQA3_DREPO|nr:hypothetical protein DPMN_187872 [Dreissena polymorpha]
MEKRFEAKEAQNWLKCMIATYTTRDVIAQLAELGFKAFYTDIRQDLLAKHGILKTTTCSSCIDPSKQCRLCSEICHRIWDYHRFKRTHLKGPSWSNTDMPPTGYKDKPSAHKTDFNGIIGALINCTWMQNYFTDDLSQNTNICVKAREEVNALRHIHDTNIDEAEMISLFDCLFNLLNDPSYLNSFKPAVEARTYLTKLQNDKLLLSDTLTKCYEDLKEEFRGDLIRFYTTTKSTVSVSPLRQGHDKPIWDIFVSPKLSHIKQQKDGSRKKTENAIKQYRNIFFKDEKLCSHVFIQGEPGIGKTTFLTKLALDWCDADSEHNSIHKASFSDIDTLNGFKFIFHISLKDAHVQREVVEMIKTQIIDTIYTGDKREVVFQLVHKILARETCLVSMDGLNEWVDPSHKYVSPLMASCFTKCVSLVTTRPWKMADERIKDSEIERLIEIEGITDPRELTENILISFNTVNQKSQTEFMEYVNERQLLQFLISPWLQTMLISLWMNNSEFNGSLCELNCILLDLSFKKGNAKEGYFRKGTCCPCLSNTSFIEPHCEILDALANAAFHFTFSSQKSLVFSKRELLDFMSKEQLQFCLDAGLLTVMFKSELLLNSPRMSFVHETVQEFLAAYYIAISQTDALENLLSKHKFNVLEMSQIIIYMCGLACKIANELINRLTDGDFFNDINLALRGYLRHFHIDKLAAFKTDYKSIENIGKFSYDERDFDSRMLAVSFLFQRIMITGFIEAKASGQKDICLKCRDFMFNEYLNESESNALRALLMYNTSNVRTLILESNILQISEILIVLQQSRDCLERVKARVTPEIYKAFYNLNLKELHFIGRINVSLIADVLTSLSNLKYLYIEDSTFHEEITISATLSRLDLTKITFTVEFLRRLLKQLSLLKHDFFLEMCDVNVTDFNKHILQSELLPIDMSNIFIHVKQGNDDLYGLLSCSPIVYMWLMTSDDAALASDILPTFSKLKKLVLCGTFIGRCDLQMPSSLNCIRLVRGECTSEWLCSLLIKLCALDHHIKCELWNFVVQSRGEDCDADSNKHGSDLRSKLLACDMSNIEIVVVSGSKELFEIFRDTSIGIHLPLLHSNHY